MNASAKGPLKHEKNYGNKIRFSFFCFVNLGKPIENLIFDFPTWCDTCVYRILQLCLLRPNLQSIFILYITDKKSRSYLLSTPELKRHGMYTLSLKFQPPNNCMNCSAKDILLSQDRREAPHKGTTSAQQQGIKTLTFIKFCGIYFGDWVGRHGSHKNDRHS